MVVFCLYCYHSDCYLPMQALGSVSDDVAQAAQVQVRPCDVGPVCRHCELLYFSRSVRMVLWASWFRVTRLRMGAYSRFDMIVLSWTIWRSSTLRSIRSSRPRCALPVHVPAQLPACACLCMCLCTYLCMFLCTCLCMYLHSCLLHVPAQLPACGCQCAAQVFYHFSH
jgi:hypothetical protein